MIPLYQILPSQLDRHAVGRGELSHLALHAVRRIIWLKTQRNLSGARATDWGLVLPSCIQEKRLFNEGNPSAARGILENRGIWSCAARRLSVLMTAKSCPLQRPAAWCWHGAHQLPHVSGVPPPQAHTHSAPRWHPGLTGREQHSSLNPTPTQQTWPGRESPTSKQ